jgi:hypothetical protein
MYQSSSCAASQLAILCLTTFSRFPLQPEFCEQYGIVSTSYHLPIVGIPDFFIGVRFTNFFSCTGGSPVTFVYNRGKKLLVKRPGFTGLQPFVTGQMNETKMKLLVDATMEYKHKLDETPDLNFIEIPW